MSETSSASSKLLHGGLRYLEHGHLGMVGEALHERAWWLKSAPKLAHPIKLFLPVYRDSPRGRIKLGAGLTIYDVLAGSSKLRPHRWWPVSRLPPDANPLLLDGLRGVFEFYDGQMDDHALGIWAADSARDAGVRTFEHRAVSTIATDGTLLTEDESVKYDCIVNAAGPWAARLLEVSGISTRWKLDLVRGSHLLLARSLETGFVIQQRTDGRIIFVLPYKQQTLIGTTEVRQSLSERPQCTKEEEVYLLNAFNTTLSESAASSDVTGRFSGVRALVDTGKRASAQPRESVIEQTGRVISIFGGKWTSSRATGRRVASRIATIARNNSC
jgi:glycerol-3-phosphate dehydrogenase